MQDHNPPASDDLSKPLSNEFAIPTFQVVGGKSEHKVSEDDDQRSTYLCGNSLGALSSRSENLVMRELQVWKSGAVVGHFNHPHGTPWVKFLGDLHPLLADVVGAKPNEVACMGTLTANLHLMMNSFYNPTKDRFKIMCEAKAFPSDQYAFASQLAMHGYDPKTALIELSPRPGEYALRTEDILSAISLTGSALAFICFAGVQYYTGQAFPISTITRAAHDVGAICGWDLAHAIGNVPLRLHDDDVDFAIWCSYKYLNAGPGAIGGLFMHEKWDDKKLPQQAGWWGHDLSTRFDMPPIFQGSKGAQGFQQSNPDILSCASLLGSLQIFRDVGGMKTLRERSLQLTGLLYASLSKSQHYISPWKVEGESTKTGFTIITPENHEDRGAQLSLLFLPPGSGLMQKVFNALVERGVIGDERKPDVIRLAPTPLYNTSIDCERAANFVDQILNEHLSR